jgi:hypothetical protein
MKRALQWTAILLLAATFAYGTFGFFRPTTHTYRSGTLSVPPVVLAWNGPSASAVENLIGDVGGLPKQTEYLTYYSRPNGTPRIGLVIRGASDIVGVTPVDEFEVLRTTVKGGDILALSWRGELAYTMEMDFRVRYADGDTAVLRWSAWGYGFALGPLVGPWRSGPAGELNVLERSWGY